MNETYITIYAIMPSYIYTTKDLSSEEKLIAERITALCRQKGYSWISNKSLADMYGIRETTVSRHIKKLRDIGFIKCLYSQHINNKLNRVIYLTNNIWDKQTSDDCLNKQEGIRYITKYNNNINNKYNNKNNIISYDEDGTMLWNGKRCESNIATEEEQKELKEILSNYKGEENER